MNKLENKRFKFRHPLAAKEKRTVKIIEVVCLLIGFVGMTRCIEVGEMDNNFSGTTLFIIFRSSV